MIDGTFDVCTHCGGEVSVQKHLIDAHMSEDEFDEKPVHLTWSHVPCGVVEETAISAQDYKSALSVMKIHSGSDVPRVDSESEELLRRFRVELGQMKTIDDVGGWRKGAW